MLLAALSYRVCIQLFSRHRTKEPGHQKPCLIQQGKGSFPPTDPGTGKPERLRERETRPVVVWPAAGRDGADTRAQPCSPCPNPEVKGR